MTEQQKLALSDLTYKILERIAIKLDCNQRPEYTVLRETWREYGLPGKPTDTQADALLSGNERLAAAELRQYVE
ncbi:MAG: hypothetical protein KDK05_10380 [Candidatus Competibacteraceae bacterium]|nr:hypothetical protein [Candidatus Competibacteraceae bacterium]